MLFLGMSSQECKNTVIRDKYATSLINSFDSYCSIKPLCSGMGEVVPARTSPTLLPPSPRTVVIILSFTFLVLHNAQTNFARA